MSFSSNIDDKCEKHKKREKHKKHKKHKNHTSDYNLYQRKTPKQHRIHRLDSSETIRLKNIANAQSNTICSINRKFRNVQVQKPKHHTKFIKKMKLILNYPEFGPMLEQYFKDDPEMVISLSLTCRDAYHTFNKWGLYRHAWDQITTILDNYMLSPRKSKTGLQLTCLKTPKLSKKNKKNVRMKSWIEEQFGSDIWDDLFD